ncbi:phosphoribosylformylglycinamidine synthase subunit PurS [Enterovirga sp. DB1703]|uniref:Phosphoribosylformylglycinamidine synthase subunit PurS n=1 Tax=Enterovirga aerilata TaxID=2730920 RepID=A0A849HYD4_9HYPH|nr:phosphoribosylformylglycinamidine synthase subunit PurS [Enterovirga sp. DB1703]
MKARVTVTLKSGVLDPQGKAIEGALASLGIRGILGVRQGKVFDVELATEDAGEAEATLRQACEKLLANTVIENFHYEVETPGQNGGGRRGRETAPATLSPDDPTVEAADDAEMPIEGHP